MVCHGHGRGGLGVHAGGDGGGVSGPVKWSTQVEESKADCMWACTSIRARSAVRIAVRVRYGGVTVRHGHGRGCLGVHAGGDGVG